MRFGKTGRFFRFLFYPICLLGIVMLLNMSPNFDKVSSLCKKRAECLYHCQTDNFPSLTCEEKKLTIEYNFNTYDSFFYYPKPTGPNMEKSEK